ncbi:hypothetical protein U9M48_025371 [Paspalum notatum var. saurae]|uniref:Uncharacterized protein n=1 Tax=Paspalum notatum var. saurae TaxID=547442 RepID=A0AAQ3TPC0_PASNO
MQLIPFSAFWLRSSVVSVLISLISDIVYNNGLPLRLLGVAQALHCSLGRRTPNQINFKFFIINICFQ